MPDAHDLATRNRDLGPPSNVMRSYEAMSKPDRRRLQKGGTLMVLVAIAYPFVNVSLSVKLPAMLWVLDFFILFVGVLFVWPPGGIWAAEKIPAAITAMIPAGRIARALGKIPDRRSGGRGSSSDRAEANE